MQMISQNKRREFMRASLHGAILCLCLLFASCGGGSVSTGSSSESIIVKGELRTSDNQLIALAEVTDLQTGETTVSNDQGRFALAVEFTDNSAKLLVRDGDFEGQATISNLDSSADQVLVKITVDRQSGIVAAVIVESLDAEDPQNGPSITHSFLFTITSSRNTPLRGVVLTSVQAEKSARSDAKGKCRLTAKGVSRSFRVGVLYKGVKGSFTLDSLPDDRSISLNVRLKLSIDEGQVDPGTGKPARSLFIEVEREEVVMWLRIF